MTPDSPVPAQKPGSAELDVEALMRELDAKDRRTAALEQENRMLRLERIHAAKAIYRTGA